MNAPPPPTIYKIDDTDRIVEVNDEFWSFATANDWTPDHDSIIGKPIWSFIDGDGAALFFRCLVEQVRETNQAFCYPFRCDSLDRRREMTMTIAPDAKQSVVFISEQDSNVPLHDAIAPPWRGLANLLCPACRRIERDGAWLPLCDAVSFHQLEVGARPIDLHNCPDCAPLEPAEKKLRPNMH